MTFFGILTVVAVGTSLAACGSDTSTTSTTTGAGGDTTTSTGDTASSTGGSASTTTTSTTSTSTTTSTSSTSSTSSSSASSSAASTSTGGSMLINGCDMTKLEDHTNAATVEIKFGGATIGLKYSPPCIKVKSGTMVTFTGSTSAHPLAPGEVVNGTPMADPTSPIKDTSGPPSVTFAIAPAGSYPYYCKDHYSSGMQGLIIAE